MYDTARRFVQRCNDCSFFVDKKTKEPIRHHVVPQKCWETVAVDLFGPMPSSRHVVVVQDIGSRYPAAKLVTSTKTDKVIPALDEIYGDYGYPAVQISDNGPPFNSQKMKQYTDSHSIKTRFATPYFPSQNPAETFMKTVGKAMKIANHSKESEAEALRDALRTYQQTPHPATDIPPANMLFQDGINTHFPRKSSSEIDVRESRKTDHESKVANQARVNSSKYRKQSSIGPGDVVLVRDCTRNSKFDPKYLPDPFILVKLNEDSKQVMLQGLKVQKVVVRHLDDVKDFHGSLDSDEDQTKFMCDAPQSEVEKAAQEAHLDAHAAESLADSCIVQVPGPSPAENQTQVQDEVSRSTRIPTATRRYIEDC